MDTNERADAHIDAALETLARPDPAADHLARVLARTGPAHATPRADDAHDGVRSAARFGAPGRPAPTALRWALPVAAMLLVAGAGWVMSRRANVPTMPLAVATTWNTPRDVDRPVLPPQAYWGMDAFEEWKSLRPGTVDRGPGTDVTGQAAGRRGSGVGNRETGVGDRRQAPVRGATATGRPAPPMAWVPVPSGLPPITLDDITPVPLDVPMLPALDPIVLEDITVAPIDAAPGNDQEKP